MAQSVVDDQGLYRSSCGYCHSGSRTSVSHGMYARQLSVEDYQALIDRGWRRSGNFLYKPAMERTCCPPYTIRLDVNDFVPSKEQRAVLRRMERYLDGDVEIKQASRDGATDGTAHGSGVTPTKRGANGRRETGSVRRGKRDLENPGLLGREPGSKPGECAAAAESRQAAEGPLPTGAPSHTDANESGNGHSKSFQSISRQNASPQAACFENGASQPDHLEKPARPSSAECIRTQVEQCVAELFGEPCPVAAAVKEVPQKVRRKLESRKHDEGGSAADELVYSCNVAFVLAARKTKGGLRNEGLTGAEGKGSAGSGQPVNGKLIPSRGENALADRSSLDNSSPQAIADAIAAGLQMRKTGDESWRVEACRGHLNFYAPPEVRGADVRASNGKSAGEQSGRGEASTSGRTSAGQAEGRDTEPEGSSKRRKHFEMRMNRAKFDREEYLLYRKYQIRVHNDAPHEVTESAYRRFLVDTPLVAPSAAASVQDSGDAPFCGFGSFHQQYRIDGRLVAVGVVDVLPHCLSSVYLFWDPDLAPLSLGKFSALKEIEWVRRAQRACPALHYYYLGFYIHNCAKMRYKAAYNPSELLCPLHYTWQPYSAAKNTLDRQPYADLCQAAQQAHPKDQPAAASTSARPAHNGSQPQSPASKPTIPLKAASHERTAGVSAGSDRTGAGSEPVCSKEEVLSDQSLGMRVGTVAEIQPGSLEDRGETHMSDPEGAPRSEEFGADWLVEWGSEGEEAAGAASDADPGMTEGEAEEGLSLDLSDESESEREDGEESSRVAGSPPATLDELGGVPLLLGDHIIPFRFFHQLGMLSPRAVQELLARLRPYQAAVGPVLFDRLVYTLV